MPKKDKGPSPKINYPDRPKVVFVKKAGMWCKTWFEPNDRTGEMTQKQEWTMEKPREDSN